MSIEITLKGVAILLDAVAVTLEKHDLVRNERLDEIRCLLEDFREDLELDTQDNEVA
tara:strand:- start:113 stop:283 length:171 start_codon:yes stop_codon:yes gene_type:complete